MKVIILAGGSGTRLWPLSRERYPKQFIKLQSNNLSLFQDTFKRSLLLADLDDIYVVTNEKYKFLVMGAVEELGYNYNESNILIEPEAKNTLPAIYAGVHELVKNGNDLVIVFPSDHIILKDQEFVNIIKLSKALTKDSIITFGIKPDGFNTGYGYIAPGKQKLNGYQVREFKEKPEYEAAITYVDEGYYWNAGIFMFNTEIFISEVKQYAENIYNAFKTSNSIKEAFSKIDENISIDYGIMEKSKNVVVAPVDIGWNDLGSFDAFYDVFDKDENNNIVNSENIVINSKNNYIYSEKGKLVSTVGVDDLIIVDNRDALLVCKKDQSQKVKEIVETLKLRNDGRREYHVQDYRPWGNYKVLEEEENSFKIKRIKVSQDKKLSYQMHYHRSEHWIVVKGMAKITIDDVEKLVPAGESIFIKPGQKHRLENLGKIPLEIIEVQMGDYLEEDDIVRFDDEYGRK
ncbi:mannose-1-phosphate guanylyltransferase/mannose-6-phosphate isomerase [Clostridium tetanomorphum]|uniref:mannose-1-phosphate guanylyltransferase n=1 Tax=Clostridium tetanomorphum TaxID=1553 RepID=A0A923E8G7_CLOTT|nr:mannose-1-phosphate guanylyltransferase/mannose-6-phosphate isomerase [Clostridium tetanomorphum]MBC2397009.1 mannose-1-phosphate guanylyltransferase/mannose-6-phosphate isomerase [Clostridium tetanomorphum]NRZ99149.1 mannose-1-phosphate guanylyltransferase/mannose-6-phosphate isomerase [Clostridium tetanomorphum]